MNRRDCLAFGISSVLASSVAWAETFPSRALRIVVPYPPGGSADILTRVIGQRLSEELGQSVVTENRPGGATVIGTMLVARAPADGYTMLCVANSFLLNYSLRAKPAYDPFNDFAPVAMLVQSPQVIVVNHSHPATTLKAFFEWARAKAGAATYATVGPGSSQQVMGETIKRMAKVDMTYVPFPGGAPAITALVGGHVDMVLQNLSEAIEQIRAGRLRALAVTGNQRLETLKDVPTLEEAGIHGFDLDVWFGLVARRGTPADALDKLSTEVRRALHEPAVREKFVGLSLFPLEMSARDFGKYLEASNAKFTAAAKAAGVTIE